MVGHQVGYLGDQHIQTFSTEHFLFTIMSETQEITINVKGPYLRGDLLISIVTQMRSYRS